MTSSILTRAGQWLAATALMAGIAFGASPTASAAFDQQGYIKCINEQQDPTSSTDTTAILCCVVNGGQAVKDGLLGNYTCKDPAAVGAHEETAPGTNPPTKPGLPTVSQVPAPDRTG